MDRTTQYPHHLARLVASQLRAEQGFSLPESLLTRFLETLYFASLKGDGERPVRCTANYADPSAHHPEPPGRQPADQWSIIPFDRPLPFDVRTVRKLGRAADPEACSLAVFSDSKHRLFIWGMADQEPRSLDEASLEPAWPAGRPGWFQATITGPGNIAVCCGGFLLGSLVENTLVQECHDVFGAGPVHELLKRNLETSLEERFGGQTFSGTWTAEEQWRAVQPDRGPEDAGLPRPAWTQQLLPLWIHSLCRIVGRVRSYRQGGGLLIAAPQSREDMHIRYQLRYDRLLRALVNLVQCRRFHRQLDGQEEAEFRRELEHHQSEVQGAIRFIAALTCAGGVVLLDKGLAVCGFDVRLRTLNPISYLFLGGDAQATLARLRRVDLAEFGARHQAMIRYCHQHAGSLGLVVSADGEAQAMMRIGEHLVLWEGIELRPVLGLEGRASALERSGLVPRGLSAGGDRTDRS
ncbi:MAG: putative sensor domain DACNV-containing protein [Thermoguttaceae bacterium]